MSRPPPLLEPYLSLTSLPPASLTLLTSILGAATNWLVLRYLQSLLATAPSEPTAVLVVSFLRDYTFWKESASRLGLDLEGLARKGRFGYVDGLSSLFTGAVAAGGSQQGQRKWTLASPALGDVGRVVGGAVDEMARGGRVILVVDGLDFLVAATGETDEGVRGMLMGWREKAHAAIVTAAADEPLVAGHGTELEREHAGLVLSLAHEARIVLSLRLLDTGTARDVGGVVRITRGGDDDGSVEDREYLYHVAGDGGARVFERGQ
ncbi:hypothetical protein OQA88_7363 [Cercophora sp. LCS_1]